MAKPIQDIRPTAHTQEQGMVELEQALLAHKEAVLETLQLLQGLQDRGILSLVNSLLGSGDKVLSILVSELNKPQNTQALRNLMGLTQLASSVDATKLAPLAESVNAGLQAAAEAASSDQSPAIWKLLQAMRDPEVGRALHLLLSVLKGMGQSLAQSAGERP